MAHVVSYATSSGRRFDLASLRSTGGVGALWGNDLMSWEFDTDDTTGAATRGSAEFDVVARFRTRDDANEFAMATYGDAAEDRDGTLYVDGWQLTCKVKSGTPEQIASREGALCKLTLFSVDPTWRRITKHSLVAESGTDTSTTGLDYPTDYAFDYAGTSRGSSMQSFRADVPCSVRVTFFGPCQNPYVQVTSASGKNTSSNYYGVDASADAGERIVIDPMGRRSVGSSVYKVGAYGERTNLFDSRRRGVEGSGSYVFATMPAGDLMVSWPQGYAVDVETIEERGSLPWS